MDFQFRPIEGWPGRHTPVTQRKRAQFKATYPQTLALLERELGYLKAKHVVLQVALDESQIRLDGLPYAKARPRHSGVILAFESKHGPLSYPCDTYDHWESNLRAIALGLEALRAVDRYGVTKTGAQYRGWQRLDAPEPLDPAEFVSRGTGFSAEEVRLSPVVRQEAYRVRAKKLHPDAGGSNESMMQLNRAYQELGAIPKEQKAK